MTQAITINWDQEGPTKGTAIGVEENIKRGWSVTDQGQGSEAEAIRPIKDILERDTAIILSGAYNTGAGGSFDVRKAVEHDWNSSFRFRTPHARAFNQLARSVIEETWKVSNSRWRAEHNKPLPYAGFQRGGWGTLPALAKDNDNRTTFYDPNNPMNAFDMFDEHGPENFSFISMNYDFNPTSRPTNPAEMMAFMKGMDEVNSLPDVEIDVHFDVPYSYGSPEAKDDQGYFIDWGLQNVLNQSWKTKFTVTKTKGKEWGAAALGLAVFGASFNYPIQEFDARVSRNGKGLARNNAFLSNVAALLSAPEFEGLKHDNRRQLRAKYKQNVANTIECYGDAVVQGKDGPYINMLSVFNLKAEEILNRSVTLHDGRKFDIRDGIRGSYDVVELLLNRPIAKKPSVGLVFAGLNDKGDPNFRLSNKQKPEIHALGNEVSSEVIDMIRNSPTLGSVSVPALGFV